MTPLKLGYFGPPGTFTHAALVASARAAGAEPVPFGTERETVLGAERGDVDAALVPIENSLEGGVNATLDTLAFDAPGVTIVGEEVLPIRHALIAPPGVTIDAIEAVVSHPQPLGQCRLWLAEHLPGRRAVAATSTAEAVRAVAAAGAPHAAIGTRTAAETYGCTILADGIEDDHTNETRFVWVARAGTDPFAGDDAARKTTLVFHGAGDATPGWLVDCLSELASRAINMTRIESRPLKRQLGHYLFVVDLEGDAAAPDVAAAIAGLRGHAEVVRVLGSYPRATR